MLFKLAWGAEGALALFRQNEWRSTLDGTNLRYHDLTSWDTLTLENIYII
jgi:hypothetical protein